MNRIGESIREHAYQSVMDSIEYEHQLLIQEIKNKMEAKEKENEKDNENDDKKPKENFPKTKYVYRIEGQDTNQPMTREDALINMKALAENDYAALIRTAHQNINDNNNDNNDNNDNNNNNNA